MSTVLKYLLVLILLLCFFRFSSGQSADSTFVKYYLNKYLEVEYIDNDQSKIYADSSLYYALRTQDPALIGKAFQYKGWYFQNTTSFLKAREMFFKSLDQFKKSGKKQLIADAYGNIGNSYLDTEEYTKSLDYQLMSLELNEAILAQNPKGKEKKVALEGRTIALHNIASIYGEVGMNRKALEYERKSLASEIEAGNFIGEAISCNSLGKMFKQQDQLDSAKFYFQKAIAIYDTTDYYPSGKAETYVSYATLKGAELSTSEKKRMLLEALEIFNSQEEIDGQVLARIAYGEEFFNELSSDSLRRIISQAENLIQAYNVRGDYDTFLKLKSRYLSRIGKHTEANKILDEFIAILEARDFEERSQELLEDDIKYELQKKVINDSLELEKIHAVERAIDQQKINEQGKLISLGIIGGVLLIGLLIVLYVANRRRKNTNILLEEKNHLIQEQKDTVDIRNKEISDSINYATRLQSAILPMKRDFDKYFKDSFVLYQPKDLVSGDFFWLDRIGNFIFVAVADCTGHGVPGAMVSVVCNNALNRSIHEFELSQPNEILEKTRELVIETFSKSTESVDDGMDIALCVIDQKTNRLNFAGANNSLWLMRSKSLNSIESDRTIEIDEFIMHEWKGDKQPIGNYPNQKPFTSTEIQLEKGDRLFMTSDGFPDQFGGPDGKKYRSATMKRLILENPTVTLEEQKVLLAVEFESWKGDEEQIDDVCVMGLLIE